MWLLLLLASAACAAEVNTTFDGTLAATDPQNVPYYRVCEFYSCTECIKSPYNKTCYWCAERNSCTGSVRLCDIPVTGVEPPAKGHIKTCPGIKADKQILIPKGTNKTVSLKVQLPEILKNNRFTCKFHIDDEPVIVKGFLLADTIFCDPTVFDYSGHDKSKEFPFSVIWDGYKVLDNINQSKILVYSCKEMAKRCGECTNLAEEYNCGWCSKSKSCVLESDCQKDGRWSSRSSICPM